MAKHVCFPWISVSLVFFHDQTFFSLNVSQTSSISFVITQFDCLLELVQVLRFESGHSHGHTTIQTTRENFLLHPIDLTTTFCLSRRIPCVVHSISCRETFCRRSSGLKIKWVQFDSLPRNDDKAYTATPPQTPIFANLPAFGRHVTSPNQGVFSMTMETLGTRLGLWPKLSTRLLSAYDRFWPLRKIP